MRRLVAPARTYEEVYRSFRWQLPESYNIAWDVCDRHAYDPSRIALIHDHPTGLRTYTFREIQRFANKMANLLVSIGLKMGDRVLIQLPQHPVTAYAHVACWKAGLISVPASILFGVDAVEYRLNNAGASVAITDYENLPKLLEASANAPDLKQIFVIDAPSGDNYLNLDDQLEKASDQFETLALTPDTPAFINYTSGTTGLPKGTLQGHRSMIGHMPGAEVLYDFYPQHGDMIWSPADWAWLAGLMDVLMPSWFHGRPVVTFPMAGFDPELALRKMGQHGIRNALLTPTMFKLLRPAKALVTEYNVNLRSIITGTESVGRELLNDMQELFPGVVINEGFGQTECNIVLGNCSSLGHHKIGSLGVALPGHVAGIVDDDGNPLPDGQVGHLAFLRPDPVMLLEYWQNPEATRAKFAGDWLLTGDQASRDEEGFFWFHGRGDDVITSSGYRIGPGEIEDAITKHPAVAMAAVIGVPDPKRTEIIRAYVVLNPGHVQSEELGEEICLSVRDRLAKHEYPRQIRFVEKLPMTTTGKILRRELRDAAKAETVAP